jgi:hypothetical protein
MSDFTAGPPSADPDGEGGLGMSGPPPVLLAALATALLIAVGVIAGFSSLGGDDSGQADDRTTGATTTTADKRVLLTVGVGGTGSGSVEITESDVVCNAACEYKFTRGVRVTATADPSTGSTFEGWGGACSGDDCSIVMDRPRNLTATFNAEPEDAPICEGVPADERDPECPPADTTTTPVEPGPDCSDGVDNDDDGLTDTAQDPDCDASGSESGEAAIPITPPSPPPATGTATADCADGRDNDDDGLTDTAQDPDCENGRSESGAPVRSAAPRSGGRARAECSDGRDNDGDGLIDTAQDPGCEANSTEAG